MVGEGGLGRGSRLAGRWAFIDDTILPFPSLHPCIYYTRTHKKHSDIIVKEYDDLTLAVYRAPGAGGRR